jgi:hypothetical protein
LTFANARAGAAERARLLAESAARRCGPPTLALVCEEHETLAAHETGHATLSGHEPPSGRLPLHHSVRTVWEYAVGPAWFPLDPRAGQVRDDTRSLTLSGHVVVTPPAQPGTDPGKTFSLRCRFVSGAYDEPPVLLSVLANAVGLEQAVPPVASFDIAPAVVPHGVPPGEGDSVRLGFRLNAQGRVDSLTFFPPHPAAESAPPLRVLEYGPVPGRPLHRLSLEAAFLGQASGRPFQAYAAAGVRLKGRAEEPAEARAEARTDGTDVPRRSQLVPQGLSLYTLEPGAGGAGDSRWQRWEVRDDLDAAGPDTAAVALDAAGGVLRFGDGSRGRVPPDGAVVLLTGATTLGALGNVPAGVVRGLARSPHNRSLAGYGAMRRYLLPARQPLPAAGGADAQTLDEAAAEVGPAREESRRAVTAGDHEWLARHVPGTAVARAWAAPQAHPSLPCALAPGNVTLVVLPSLPAARPAPSRGLLRAVAAYLGPRRVIGTAVHVVGPSYRRVAVRARVTLTAGARPADVRDRVASELDRFFHPLHGGEDGGGWPFGRDVYRAEVLQRIDQTSGVDHVLSLELLADGADPTCGNVCLGPFGLVAAGPHEIETVQQAWE